MRTSAFCLVAAIACGAAALAAAESAPAPAAARWSPEKAWEWYRAQPWICGFNYVPSSACNTTEFWQAESFDAPAIDRERRLAIPHGGHNMFFADGEGSWWSTFFGNDPQAPFRERPGLLRVEFGLDGGVRPYLPAPARPGAYGR